MVPHNGYAVDPGRYRVAASPLWKECGQMGDSGGAQDLKIVAALQDREESALGSARRQNLGYPGEITVLEQLTAERVVSMSAAKSS